MSRSSPGEKTTHPTPTTWSPFAAVPSPEICVDAHRTPVTVTADSVAAHHGCVRAPRTMGSWTCLFLSTRRRCSRNRSLERSVDRIADSVQTGRFTAPVVDYEPPPLGVAAVRRAPPPAPAALRGAVPPVACRVAPVTSAPAAPRRPRGGRSAPPRAAAMFADAALRRVLEVIDRRRPIAQLRPMLTPPLLDMVFALTRTAGPDKAAVLRRVRLRTAAVDDREPMNHWPPRCSRRIPAGDVSGPSPAASKSTRGAGAWWPYRSDNKPCRETPSASNVVIKAPAREIFALLADAGRHSSFDGSGTVDHASAHDRFRWSWAPSSR